MSMNTDLSSFWMPFTAQADFVQGPRMLTKAEGVHYTSADGRAVLDAVSGLWCVSFGHGRQALAQAAQQQILSLDYAPMFQMGHPVGFEYAQRLLRFAPDGYGKVFLSNSGSEAIDTALKMALQYQRMRGEGARTRIIGRERGYHGVGFGGISVGGMASNRKHFGPLLPGVDHIRHTHDLSLNAFSVGQPKQGRAFAEDLERIIALHDPSTIAAVVVEPVAGSAGVLVPPEGYLERLREITSHHGILLIFDEVITGFGRTGASFASARLGVHPDILVSAKAISNGIIPLGATLVRREMLEVFESGAPNQIGFYHGYTSSAHPVACAVAGQVLDIIQKEDLLARSRELEAVLAESIHALRGLPGVIDIRNFGLMGAVELEPIPGAPGARGLKVLKRCFESGVLVRSTGDTIALAPALVSDAEHIRHAVETVAEAIEA